MLQTFGRHCIAVFYFRHNGPVLAQCRVNATDVGPASHTLSRVYILLLHIINFVYDTNTAQLLYLWFWCGKYIVTYYIKSVCDNIHVYSRVIYQLTILYIHVHILL